MIESVKYNLSNLTNFEGRDARQTFWFYVLFLIILQFVASLIVSIPMMVGMFQGAFEAARSGADPQQLNAAMFEQLEGSLKTQIWISVILGVLSVLLFVAAFVRRLHDSGKPGWLALLAIGPYLAALAINVSSFDKIMASTREAMTATDPNQAMAMQSELYAYSILPWIGYLVVIAFGVMKSDEGANKYGEAPVRF